MKQAHGTFEVKVTPAAVTEIGQAAGLGRMTIDKVFAGDLAGVSKGEMLTGMNQSTGAMAYVALECVTASIDGRKGSFLLMHHATMLKSDPASGVMQVTVVAKSGTEQLRDLEGSMSIAIDAAGRHSYDFTYTLPDAD